ncbi:AMP-binding protein [Sphingosinicella terrae]|uniref:AMP-binding protein n=1 Tax=Sphingosinicella terrae TaxID=2172047 RepID=UPI000E0CC352|nr:AMP-binding protein [Sphingosinicella terrae]
MSAADIPFREAQFLPVDLAIRRRPDGTIDLRSNIALEVDDPNLPRAILRRASAQGSKPAIAWRGPDGQWQYLRYDHLRRDIEAAAQWLIDHVPRGRTFLVMAGNGPKVAVLTVAAWAAGVVLCPVGPAYGQVGGNLTRLRHVFAKANPAIVYADPDPALAAAIEAVAGTNVMIVASDPGLYSRPAVPFGELVGTAPDQGLHVAIDALDPHDVSTCMLTSGSTGLPKLVALSLSNLAANSAQGYMSIGRAAGWDDVMIDWLPWHHAAGAGLLRNTLLNGGTLHIDAGKPAPGLFDETVRNLREISSAWFSNVPAGYAMLLDALTRDPVLRSTFFSKMRLMLYGGAGLAQPVYDALQALAVEQTGHRIHMSTGYGMTESVSACMTTHFRTERVGIGLPAPGLEVKLVPYGERYEVRLRGPNIMRSYLGEPEITAAAFDGEGYYRTGDLACFHEPDRPEEGLAFAGRIAEEFKLAGGTWVYGGPMRDALLDALSPHIAELVLCDDNRDVLGVLAWPKPSVPAELLDWAAARLAVFNAGQHGESARVRRFGLFSNPPDPRASEVSDKGTINRRAVLDNRRDEVDRLYAAAPGRDIRVIP